MTRLLEPYRLEATVTTTEVKRSAHMPGVWIMWGVDGQAYYLKGVPNALPAMLKAHKALSIKVRKFENTNFVERILSIQKAR